MYTSPNIGDKLKLQEENPVLVKLQCVVYVFKCDLCDADCIGYTTRHLHPQRIEENRASAVGKHINEVHAITTPELNKHVFRSKEMPRNTGLLSA